MLSIKNILDLFELHFFKTNFTNLINQPVFDKEEVGSHMTVSSYKRISIELIGSRKTAKEMEPLDVKID